MIPRIARNGGTGSSFKGAGLYYLHDKKAMTQERIGESHVINMLTHDAGKAIGVMAATAIDQATIKKAAGVKATGRKLTKPVFCYSLSWHKDDKPTAEHMIEQAKDSLKTLGLDNKQAVVVEHQDTQHPHVHIIVNRVDPQTGIADPLKFTKEKLSRWASAYEEQHEIRCKERQRGSKKVELKPEEFKVKADIKLQSQKPTKADSQLQEEVYNNQTKLDDNYKEKLAGDSFNIDWKAELAKKADLPIKAVSHAEKVANLFKSVQNWAKEKAHSAWIYIHANRATEQHQQETRRR